MSGAASWFLEGNLLDFCFRVLYSYNAEKLRLKQARSHKDFSIILVFVWETLFNAVLSDRKFSSDDGISQSFAEGKVHNERG